MYVKLFTVVLFMILVFSSYRSNSQSDPEFPKGFITYVKLHDGLITNFTSGPDVFIGGMQIQPQITLVKHLVRAGLTGDLVYLNKKLQLLYGPSLSLKLKTFNAGVFGSAGNLNVLFDHLWGTGHQRLAGAGIIADIGNLLTIGLTAHRDYYLNSWWFQNELGIRISKKKKITEPFNQ